MDVPRKRLRWAQLVKVLVDASSMSQVARDLQVTAKEVKRWLGGTEPSAENARNILRFCDTSPLRINWKAFEGLAPVYDFGKAFDRNVAEGPHEIPNVDAWLPTVDTEPLFGRQLNSPIGVPASNLTINSHWIEPLARLGFDIITSKTARTRPMRAHPFPNIVYLPDLQEPVPIGSMPATVIGVPDLPHEDIERLSYANSFGMPGPSPVEWQVDLRRSIEIVENNGGQLLIASVVGTVEHPQDDLVEDFIQCTGLAWGCKPHAVEQNYSCPNDYGPARSVYETPETAARIAEGTRVRFPDIKLLVKIGYLPPDKLEALFKAVYKYVDGFTCINTVSARIISQGQNEEPVFPGERRVTAGVSGPAIREYALETVKSIRRLANAHKPELVVIGVGGITNAEHVRAFLVAGANVVQICSAAQQDPMIAARIRHELLRDTTQSQTAQVRPTVPLMFRDDVIALTFERTMNVANRDGLYFDECWKTVEQQWVAPYRNSILAGQESGLQFKTRRAAPTEQDIRRWIRSAKSSGK